MGSFGDFYNKNRKKPSKDEMTRKANRSTPSWAVPQPQVISKVKKDRFS